MITVGELAERIQGVVDGDPEGKVSGISSIDDVTDENHVVYLAQQKDDYKLRNKRVAAVICSQAATLEGHTLIRAENPRLSFAYAMRFFYPVEEYEGTVHPTAVIEDGAVVSPSAHIGANCFVGAGALIDEDAVVLPGCHVGRNVSIGSGCLLHPNSTVLDRCRLGKRVILHSGVVIGGDGFGFVQDKGCHLKVPQIGNVIIGDDVEIGANTAIDRATLGSTQIGRGTKIDNLVQIGHNCIIGEHCILCGEAGLAGSCEMGDYVVLAGQVGLSDHVKIGSGTIVGGKAGVTDDIPEKSFYSGFPARPHRENKIMLTALARLPELAKKVDELSGESKEKD